MSRRWSWRKSRCTGCRISPSASSRSPCWSATMVCYLNLSRRLELVVARSAGVSAWQFVKPAVVIALLIGILVTTVYNPLSATFRERSERLEAQLSGDTRNPLLSHSGFWLRQRSQDGQSIINARNSRQQGAELSDVSIFTLDDADGYLGRIEAKQATLHDGFWRLEDARVYAGEAPPTNHKSYDLKTNLTRAQVQESFATPETVPFWQLLPADHPGRALRPRRRRLPAAILPVAGPTPIPGGDGASGRGRQPPPVPFWRGATDGPGWRRSRAFCSTYCRKLRGI